MGDPGVRGGSHGRGGHCLSGRLRGVALPRRAPVTRIPRHRATTPDESRRSRAMTRGLVLATLAVLLLPFAATANQELMSLQNDDGQWAMAGKNYSSHPLQHPEPGHHRQREAAEGGLVVLPRGPARPRRRAAGGRQPRCTSTRPSPTTSTPWTSTKEGAPIKWTYTPKTDKRAVPVACCDVVQRGLNFAAGKILFATLDGQVIALDANTGKEVWKIKNANPAQRRDDDDGRSRRQGQVHRRRLGR